MSEQTLTEVQAAAIPATIYQEFWNSAALADLLNGFSDDIVVEFADLPKIKGKAELERVLRARLARQKGYRLEKTLRAVTDPTIIGSWEMNQCHWSASLT